MRLIGLVLMGFVLNACGSSRTCRKPDAPPTYNTDVKTIINAKCVTCHGTAKKGTARNNAPGDLNYDTYALLSANLPKEDPSQAINDIEKNTMPPAGNEALTAAERDTLLQWLYCGLAE